MSLRINPEHRSGSGLRALRESRGLTRSELAANLGYTARTIARWESGGGRIREAAFQYLLGLAPRAQDPTAADFTFVDLFAGIGGFRIAFERAGGRCTFTSEWDKYAQITYRKNFGDHEVHGDITKVHEAQVPDHDILLAGFPCQPFSIAGVSKKNALGRKHGFECTTQGTLFFDIQRIIAEKKPKAFVLENVKNLSSHDGGKTFEVIRRTLEDELEYNLTWKIIDARRYLPQHRERIFIVGIRPDLNQRFDWDKIALPDPGDGPRLRSILHPEDGTEPCEERFLESDGTVRAKYVLTPKLWAYLQGYAAKHLARGNGFGFGLVTGESVARTLSARYYKDGSEILIERPSGPPRRLTPRECARLMGFDSARGAEFKIPVSDTQAYRQFGNSVAVPVVEAIARALVPLVVGSSSQKSDGSPPSASAA